MAQNTGTFFKVNDNDGIPLVGVSTNGKVVIAPLYGNLGIGTTNPREKLDIIGNVSISGIVTFIGDARVGIDTSQGLILTSSNGIKYRLIVSNAGVLSTIVVT